MIYKGFVLVFLPITSLVLPPIETKDVLEDSASIDVLTNKVRDQMLTALLEISAQEDPKTK